LKILLCENLYFNNLLYFFCLNPHKTSAPSVGLDWIDPFKLLNFATKNIFFVDKFLELFNKFSKLCLFNTPFKIFKGFFFTDSTILAAKLDVSSKIGKSW